MTTCIKDYGSILPQVPIMCLEIGCNKVSVTQLQQPLNSFTGKTTEAVFSPLLFLGMSFGLATTPTPKRND